MFKDKKLFKKYSPLFTTNAIETATGLIFDDFSQRISIEPYGSLVVVSGDLDEVETGNIGQFSYEQQGHFDYGVLLDAASPYGPITLRPPEIEPTDPLTRATMDTGDIIVSDLVDEKWKSVFRINSTPIRQSKNNMKR
jgi:hypothetical protein